MPKGHYDRSTSKWLPPPQAEYPAELVEQVRTLYQAGRSMREVAELAGTTVKVLQRLMPRHGIERRRAVKRDQRGPANHMWRGVEAGYQALHLRVEAARGKPKRCAACDTESQSRTYDWANLTGHYDDPQDYVRLCRHCHRRLDARRRATTGERTSPAR
jgi:hypothetical protein